MRIVLLGAGGHGRVVLDAVRAASDHDVVGWLDGSARRTTDVVDGVTVLGGEERLHNCGAEGFIVTVGSNGGGLRRRLFDQARAAGLRPASVIHPTAHVSPTATIGAGSVVLAAAVVNTHCRIGDNVIVNTRAVAEHDCLIGDDVHLAPGSVICGGVTIGSGVMVGAGSTVREGLRIGSDAVVALGSAVVSDVPEAAVVMGTPARELERP